MSMEDKHLTQLARDAAADISSIAEKEVRLARIEMQENIREAVNGVTEMISSLAILIPAVTIALAACGFGLATIDGVSTWGGLAIVAGVAAIAGFALLGAGKGSLKPGALFPTKTATNLRRDAKTVKEAV